jgi:hypothetical protein
MPVNGGEAVRVTRAGGYAPFESPDGRAVYYIKGDKEVTSLCKVPVDGGEESQVLGSIWAHNFAVANRGIYFIPGPDRVGRFFIHFFSFATGQVKQIAGIQKQPLYGFSVSPDERCILYTQVDQTGSDLMLVENFH